MEQFISQLHFIRPAWFYAFIPLIILSVLFIKSHSLSRSWQNIIDPKLLPHLLVGKAAKHSALPGALYFIIGAFVIISLAGPAWEKRPQPVFKEQSALVIALDLSRSMDAGDIKPSRLTRARHKITDILNQRKLGQTALIVYAADAYTVSPLTDDTATITALLSSLTTALMPAQGTRTDKVLEQAASLFDNAGVSHGDILLVTDGIESTATTMFTTISKNHRISILAVATNDGAPIPQATGGFVKDRSGNIVLPKLDTNRLKNLIKISKGNFSVITSDDSDIKNITTLFDNNRFEANKKTKASTLQTDSWYEQGPWLLLFIIPLAALAFRRGVLFVLVIIMLQQPEQAQANSLWDSLWYNDDQRASKLLEQDKTAEAAELFNNRQWKAASHYKNKQYQKTIDALQDTNTADGHYNKGNAYAKLGENEKALEEYATAIKLDPKHEDALFNKEVLEKQQEQKKEQQQSGKDNSKSSKDNKQSDQNKQPSEQGQADQNKDSSDKKNKGHKNSDKNEPQQDSQSSDQESENDSNKNSKSENKTDKQESANKNNAEEKNGQQQESKDSRDSDKESDLAKTQADDAEQKHNDKITKQWLRRIPDDPGGLLRNKFRYQYKRQQQQSNEEKNW